MAKVKKTVQCRNCRKRFIPADARRREHVCPYCDEVTGPRETITQLKGRVWSLFSRFIKLRDANLEHGGSKQARWVCLCVTCGKEMEPYDIDCHAGHFLDGRTKGILFDERGVHVQCARCNMFLHGNKDAYWVYMLNRYGRDTIDELLDLKHKHQGSWKLFELRDLADHYENLLEARKAEMEKVTHGKDR